MNQDPTRGFPPRMEWWAKSLSLFGILSLLLAGCADSKPSPHATEGSVPIAQQTATATATPDILATARANGCDVTAYSAPQSAWDGLERFYPVTYRNDNIVLWPVVSGQAIPNNSTASQVWYTGPMPVMIEVAGDAAGSEPSKIAGHRLDGSQTPLTVSVEPSASGENGYALDTALLDFSSSGCWQIDVTSGSSHLSVIVYVTPSEERPLIAQLVATHQALLPYAVPSSCAVTDWTGPVDPRPIAPAGPTDVPFQPLYWLIGQGVSAGSATALLWEGEGNPLTWILGQWTDLQITGQSIDEPFLSLRVSLSQSVGRSGSRWKSTLVFPAAGCWTITATAGTQQFDATVYVYPAMCQHDVETPVATGCRP